MYVCVVFLFSCLLSSVLCCVFMSFFCQFLIKSELVLFKARHGLMKGPTRSVFYTNTIRQRLNILLYARIFVRFCFELSHCCCRFLWRLLHTLFCSVTPCSPSSHKTSVRFSSVSLLIFKISFSYRNSAFGRKGTAGFSYQRCVILSEAGSLCELGIVPQKIECHCVHIKNRDSRSCRGNQKLCGLLN